MSRPLPSESTGQKRQRICAEHKNAPIIDAVAGPLSNPRSISSKRLWREFPALTIGIGTDEGDAYFPFLWLGLHDKGNRRASLRKRFHRLGIRGHPDIRDRMSDSRIPSPLEPEFVRTLKAARGFFDLGMFTDAGNELEELAPETRHRPR
jgi:hypothetical protein